jgi:hypothetical protein
MSDCDGDSGGFCLDWIRFRKYSTYQSVTIGGEMPLLETKTCYNMSDGDSCNVSWILNTTGEIGTKMDVFTMFYSEYGGSAPHPRS